MRNQFDTKQDKKHTTKNNSIPLKFSNPIQTTEVQSGNVYLVRPI